uniref:Zinc finger C2HC domain-containing protein 1A n=1 Tax=Steinernema glaseri TaxID=37863 RepID=A0A1I7ZUK6_9BILA
MASELFNFRNLFTRQQRTAAKTATSTSSSSNSSKKSSGGAGGPSQFWSNPRKEETGTVKNPFGKEDYDQYATEETFPCSMCGRSFIKSSLEKHEPACRKITNLNRKKFDSGKQRADGSDVTLQGVRKAQKEREKMGGSFPRPKTSWREKHTTFITAVASSKQVEYALKSGAPLPPPPKTSVPSDYVQCEYCGRNFNQNAAERHIPFCREQQMRNRRSTSHSRVPHTPLNKPKTAQRSSSSSRPPLPPTTGHGAPSLANGGTAHSFRANRPPSRRSSSDRSDTAKSRAGTQRPAQPTSSSRRSTSAPRTSQSPSRSQLKTPTSVRLKR